MPDCRDKRIIAERVAVVALTEAGGVLQGCKFDGKTARCKAVRLAQFGFFAVCLSGGMAIGQVEASPSLSVPLSASAVPTLTQAKIHSEWRRQQPILSLSAVDNQSAILAFGPLRYADGAIHVPGRTMPSLPPLKTESDATKVGRSTSAPTAWKSSDGFDYLAVETATEEASGYGFDQLPLVSSAHAAAPDSNDQARHAGVGGPMARLPIGGHMMFDDASADLGSETLAKLEMLVSTLKSSRSSVEILAYAGRPSSKSSRDRRLALRRGLAVRAFLVARGIDQSRISVRPMGGVRDSGPPARADVFYVSG